MARGRRWTGIEPENTWNRVKLMFWSENSGCALAGIGGGVEGSLHKSHLLVSSVKKSCMLVSQKAGSMAMSLVRASRAEVLSRGWA